jgi:hypothetical protein
MSLPALPDTNALALFNESPTLGGSGYASIKIDSGVIKFVIDGDEERSDDTELKCIILDVRPTTHRVKYDGAFDVSKTSKEQKPSLCMSNDGVTPVTWAQPINGKDGQRVLSCNKCPYSAKDAEELFGKENKCTIRQVIYVIPAEYPDRVFTLDVATGAVFNRDGDQYKPTGLKAYLTTAARVLAKEPHPINEEHPGSNVKTNIRTVWSYIVPNGTTLKNSYGFSLYSVKRNAAKTLSFITAEEYAEVAWLYSDPALADLKAKPLFTEREQVVVEAAEPADIPAPPMRKQQPQDVVDVFVEL